MSMEEQGAPNMKDTPIYRHSMEYALEHQEIERYWASQEANVACKETIENSVLSHHDGYYLDADAAIKEVVGAFGFERTFLVLANTVQHKEWDGRISRDNIEWARGIPVPEDRNPSNGSDRNALFVVDRASAGLTDLFLQFVRRDYLRTQPLNEQDIADEARRIGVRLRDTKNMYQRKRVETDKYPVQVSSEFMIRATMPDMDRLREALPFRGVLFGAVEGKKGYFAMIPADGERAEEKEPKKRSVRKKLQERADAPAAPKPSEKRKAKKPER